MWLQAILRQAVSGDAPTILGNLSTVFSNASPHPLDHSQDLIRVPSVRRLELPSLYHWVSRNPVSALCHIETTKRSVSFFLLCLFSSPPCFLDGDQTSHNSQHPDQGFRKFTTASISNLCRHIVTSVRLFYGDWLDSIQRKDVALPTSARLDHSSTSSTSNFSKPIFIASTLNTLRHLYRP